MRLNLAPCVYRAVERPDRPRRFVLYLALAAGAMGVLASGCSSDHSTSLGTTSNSNGMGQVDGGGASTGGTTGAVGTTGGTGTPGTTGNGGTTGTTAAPLPEMPNQCGGISREAPEARGGVDVVFLLDTSGSMLHATQQVTMNLSGFIQDFETTVADTRVVMITRDDPAAGTAVANMPDRYRFIAQDPVDSSQLYTVALARFADYQDFLRPNAATQFVMITDDNDAVAPEQFRTEMESLLGHGFTQHAIASENVMGNPCLSEAAVMRQDPLCVGLSPIIVIPAICGAAAIGETYYTLADTTGGVKASICKADWTSVFEELKGAVIDAVPLPCDYALADVESTSIEDFDPKKVQIRYQQGMMPEEEFPRADTSDACGDRRGWFYDDPANPSTISLCPAACDAVQQGGSIKLAFGCAPTPLI